MKISIYEDSDERDLQEVGCIQNDLRVFTTRAMRNEFVNRYFNCGMKSAIHRDIRFMTWDLSSKESSRNILQNGYSLRITPNFSMI